MNRSQLIAFARKNWMLILGAIYLISPLDFIPDLLPALGLGDDLFVILATLVIRYRTFKKEENRDVVDGEVVEEKNERASK